MAFNWASDFAKIGRALLGSDKFLISDPANPNTPLHADGDQIAELVIGAPDGSTPGSVLARLDDAEGDIASLGAAVGPLPVAIDALDTRVTAAEADIAALDGRVTTAEGDIAAAESDIAALETALPALDGAQIVSTSSATVTARHVYVTYSAGDCTLTLPAAADLPFVQVIKANSSIYSIIVNRAGSDTINGGTSITFTALYAGGEVRVWQAGQWVGGPILSPAGAEARIAALQAGTVPAGNILRTTTAGPHTIGAEISDVCQAYAGAQTYVMPAATVGRRVSIVKETTHAGTITLDPAGSDTIHGSASNYVLDGSDYVTSATTYRRAWTAVCYVAGEWQIT